MVLAYSAAAKHTPTLHAARPVTVTGSSGMGGTIRAVQGRRRGGQGAALSIEAAGSSASSRDGTSPDGTCSNPVGDALLHKGLSAPPRGSLGMRPTAPVGATGWQRRRNPSSSFFSRGSGIHRPVRPIPAVLSGLNSGNRPLLILESISIVADHAPARQVRDLTSARALCAHYLREKRTGDPRLLQIQRRWISHAFTSWVSTT
jgi:hypothetical protein